MINTGACGMRADIMNDQGYKLCELVKDGDKGYLVFKTGRRFDTLQLDSLYSQLDAYAANSRKAGGQL